MSNTAITLSAEELEAITGYAVATKQLQVLHRRGFHRAYINRLGAVVLERVHYEAVSQGSAPAIKGKKAFGVQYHPEASPGPMDSFYLFQKFVGSLG